MQENISEEKKIKKEFKKALREWEDKKEIYSGIRAYLWNQDARQRRKGFMKILSICEI